MANFDDPAANWNQRSPGLLLPDSKHKNASSLIHINNFRRKVNLNPAGMDSGRRSSEKTFRAVVN